MDTVSEFGSRLLMPHAAIGGVLLALEGVSWFLVNWKVPKHKFRRAHLPGLLPFIVYVGLVTLSGWDALPRFSSYQTASSSAGMVAFLFGWWIRHAAPLTRWVGRHSALLRRLCSYTSGLMRRTRHRRYFGAWLEIIGLGLIWQSPIASTVALVGFYSAATLAIQWEERKFLKTDSPKAWEEWRSRSSGFWPDLKGILTPVAILVLAGLLGGVFAREFVIFYSTRQTAIGLLMALAQILATVAVLCITIIFVVVQVSTEAYSPRVSRHIVMHPSLALSVGAFVVAISYCLLLAAHSGNWFPPSRPFDNVLVDFAPFLACVALASLGIFAREAIVGLSPQGMIDRALEPLDVEWMEMVRQGYLRPERRTLFYVDRDPLIRLEPLLRTAIIQEDRTSFFTAMTILGERLLPLIDADDILMLDTYLGSHFAGLARLAARHRHEEPLTQIIDFFDGIGVPSDVSLQSVKSPLLAGLPGCEVPRLIVEAALDNRLSEATTSALRRIHQVASHWMKVLPAQEDTIMYKPERVSQGLSREESNRLVENWMRVRVLPDNYVRYICRSASRAARDNMPDVARIACNFSLELAHDILVAVKGREMRTFLTWKTLHHVSGAMDALLEAGHRLGFALMGLGTYFLGPHPVDADVAAAFSGFGARLVQRALRLSLLDYGSADAIGLMAVGLTRENPLPTMSLLESMTQAMATIHDLPGVLEDEELRMAYDQLGDRVRKAIDGAPKEFCHEHSKQLQKMVEVANQPLGSAGA